MIPLIKTMILVPNNRLKLPANSAEMRTMYKDGDLLVNANAMIKFYGKFKLFRNRLRTSNSVCDCTEASSFISELRDILW